MKVMSDINFNNEKWLSIDELCLYLFGRKINSLVRDYNQNSEFLLNESAVNLFKKLKNNLDTNEIAHNAKFLNKAVGLIPAENKRVKKANSIKFILEEK